MIADVQALSRSGYGHSVQIVYLIRVYSEAPTMDMADELGKKLMQVVYDMQSKS